MGGKPGETLGENPGETWGGKTETEMTGFIFDPYCYSATDRIPRSTSGASEAGSLLVPKPGLLTLSGTPWPKWASAGGSKDDEPMEGRWCRLGDTTAT